MARVARVVKSEVKLDTTDQKIGQDGIVTMSSTGPAMLDKPDIQIVDGVRMKSKAEDLAFMNEPVEIMVLPSQSPDDPPIFSVWNDGVRQNLIRGEKQTVKRKYVEVLARAKKQSYGNVEAVNHSGDKEFRYPSTTAQVYPFTVVRDSDKGVAWLQGILAEAA